MKPTRSPALVIFLTLAACAGARDEPGSKTAELWRPTPPTIQGNPFPLMKAVLDELVDRGAIPGQNKKTECKACSFTTGKIYNPATDMEGSTGKEQLPSLDFWSPPELPSSKLNALLIQGKNLAKTTVLADASADNVKSTLGTLRTLFGLLPFAEIDESVTNTEPTAEPWVVAFRPVYGRHRRSDSSILGTTNYSNPLLLDELTDRGARSYCAMREAARHAFLPNLPMLQHELAKVIWWHFGKTDADLTLTPTGKANRIPQTPSDVPGAQAFVIPFAIGATVAPLSGPFVPDFGTFEHPIAWITGDAEVLSVEDKTGSPLYAAKTYRDIEHVDAFAGAAYHGGIGVKNIELANFGLFQLSLFASMKLTIGELEDGDQVYDADADAPLLAGGRVLFDKYQGAHGLWPAARHGVFDNQSNGVIDAAIATPICGENNLEFPAYVGGGTGCIFMPGYPQGGGLFAEAPAYLTAPAWGTAARWRNDDDRQFALKDQMDLELGVTGSGGIDFGLLKIGVEASMSLDAHSSVETVVREALSEVKQSKTGLMPLAIGTKANSGSNPDTLLQTNFTVTPVANDWIGITPLKAGIVFHLGKLPLIGNIDWKLPILDPDPINLAGTRIFTPEKDRLRVGEYSEAISSLPADSSGTPTYSHLPGIALGNAAKFSALPGTVAQCLADDTVVGKEPQPKPSKPADTDIPYGLCYYGPSTKSLDIFANAYGIVPGYLALAEPTDDICAMSDLQLKNYYALHFANPDQWDCMVMTTQYLCGELNNTTDPAISRIVHDYKGLLGTEDMIAHLIQPFHGEEALTNTMWNKCTPAFNLNDGSAMANFIGQMFTMTFVQVHICDKKTLQPVGNMPDCDADPLTPDCFQIQACKEDAETCTCDSCPGGRCVGDGVVQPYFCKIDPATGECPPCGLGSVPQGGCAPVPPVCPPDGAHGQ